MVRARVLVVMKMISKSKIIAALVVGLVGNIFSQDFRIFTSLDGREIEAKLVKVDPRTKKVTLERRNRKKAAIPVNALSETDQTYIKDWASAQDFLSNSKFRISLEKRKDSVNEKRVETKRPKAPCYYEIKFQNRSSADLSGLKAEYCIYKVIDRSRGSANDSVEVIHDRKSNIALDAGAEFLWQTEQVKLYRIYSAQMESSYDQYGSLSYSTSYNKVSEDDVEGLWVKLTYTTSMGNTFSREICEPDSIRDDFTWKSSR